MKRGAVGGRKYGDADIDPAPCPTDDKDRSAVGDADDTNAAPCLADGTANRSDTEAAPCPANGTANRSHADDTGNWNEDPAPCPADDEAADGSADDAGDADAVEGGANLSDADDDTVDGAADDTEIDEESVD